jgi:predicted ATP-binding protein involved in virulence
MLGIASKIENGSLICIDEPEICLHPAWQEKYIRFLMNTFKDYKGCHFLIATHSPQITSKLEDENCYVMSMDDGKLVSASTLNNKSIDFQLAHVFKSPGFKNEYLTRELISLITLISEGKGQEELHSTKIEEILALKDVIDDDDPVKELIKMVESVKKELS